MGELITQQAAGVFLCISMLAVGACAFGIAWGTGAPTGVAVGAGVLAGPLCLLSAFVTKEITKDNRLTPSVSKPSDSSTYFT